jgi:hypothetical protein
MSASQSLIPPGAESKAVCGLYTLMPWLASRSNDCCCEFARVKAFKPRNIMGWYAMTIEELSAIASSATAFVRSMVRRAVFDWRRDGTNGASSSKPVLSHELSASSCGYLVNCQYLRAAAVPSNNSNAAKHKLTVSV